VLGKRAGVFALGPKPRVRGVAAAHPQRDRGHGSAPFILLSAVDDGHGVRLVGVLRGVGRRTALAPARGGRIGSR